MTRGSSGAFGGKFRRDDMIIAQGKRSAALGKEPKMNASLFPSFVFPGLEAWEKQNSGKGRPGGRVASKCRETLHSAVVNATS